MGRAFPERKVNLDSAFAVPRDYERLTEFATGEHGWFVPDEVREAAGRLLRELVWLRTLAANGPLAHKP